MCTVEAQLVELRISVAGPHLVILEQPKQRGFRFRYGCEGPSHGGLPGASSEKGKKTFPTVQIRNYEGHAKIEVDLVNHMDSNLLHAHSLVGKHCTDDGICIVHVGPKDMTAQFCNLGILHVTKKDVLNTVINKIKKQRLRERGHSTYREFTVEENAKIKKEGADMKMYMDLSIVCLRFTAYLPDSSGQYVLPLKPVVSVPIHDSKAPGASNLKISRMDKTAGSVLGGDEVYLLCDKVQKDDIEVRFFENEAEGWQAFGQFSPTDVHKQCAIVFKTPPYYRTTIDKPVTVFLQLKRKRGGDASEPKQFTYYPEVKDKEGVGAKRKKVIPYFQSHFGDGPAAGGGGGGGGGAMFGTGGGFGGNVESPRMNFLYSINNHTYNGSTQMSGGMQKQKRCATAESPQQVGAQQGDAQTETQAQESTTAAENRNNVDLRRQALLGSLGLHMIAQRTARALQDYAKTADPRILMAVQIHQGGAQDENGDTPLHLAVIHQKTAVIQQLVQVITSIPNLEILNMTNHLNQTPLHLAVITKQYGVAAYLLEAGANPIPVDLYGNSVLHIALQAGDEKMVTILLQGAKPANKYLISSPDYNGMFPVHLAVKAKSEKCLELLVKNGADVNVVERKSGRSLLHLAVEMDNLSLATYLVKKLHAQVNVRTFSGNTPLHHAASMGSPILTKMLVSAGADVMAENDEPVFDSEESSESETDTDSESETDDNVGAGTDEETEMDTQHEPETQTMFDSETQMDLQAQASSYKDTDYDSDFEIEPKKRRIHGHTPLDLTKSDKVRDILLNSHASQSSALQHTETSKREKIFSLDWETLTQLEKLLDDDKGVLADLAKTLGLQSLVDSYRSTPSPSESLLKHYELLGGTEEQLIAALESMGLTEGVRLLQRSELQDKLQNTEVTLDSAYGSESIQDSSSKFSGSHSPPIPPTDCKLVPALAAQSSSSNLPHS
nr:PREDICTED: nuclear factor NF-kappa-B p100 subunit [Latimeria chalumnae]|eukprot:XP_014340475.1 PREDICTED: nuclear factor NF-kappa-B p100 subunit [Latimeria chalumnae]